MRVLICGGGVIGASIAYFLARRNIEVVVAERLEVACAASGKSGGFLARDWNDGSPVGPLARRSFELHAELAAGLGAEWGYRRLDTLSVVASARRELSAYRQVEGPDWVGREAAVHGQIGTTESTAQVHPALFTKALMEAAIGDGAALKLGCVEGITFSDDRSTVTGAIVDGETIAADTVVIAMGPWSILACAWLPLPATHGLKGHSLIFDHDPGPQVLFVEYVDAEGRMATPEIYPRPDGTTYVCGLPGEAPIPVDPSHVLPEAGASEILREMAVRVAPGLADANILAEQSCYRPVLEDGLPVIGQVPGIRGAYVATGHSVWGILNAPATGEAMAELIATGAATLDLSAFDPGRLAPLPPGAVQTSDTRPQ